MMRTNALTAVILAFGLSACGMENLFGNIGKSPNERPASTLQGLFPNAGLKTSQYSVSDGGGTTVVPFDTRGGSGSYEVRFPSSKYSMVMLNNRTGDTALRALVPFLDQESVLSGVNLDARSMTEALIVEANLSARGLELQKMTPSAYLGTRTQIQAAIDQPGPTQDLFHMVERLIPKGDPTSGSLDPFLFLPPELNPDWTVKSSALDAGWIARLQFDYDGDGNEDVDSTKFDAKLAAAAQLFKPEGCPDPKNIQLVFSVDFNQSALNGNGGAINRFLWAKDKPGKKMYFVGWIHKESVFQDAADCANTNTCVNKKLGESVPNVVSMYDDGTNGDEVAGDNIWTVAFQVPIDPNKVLRVGYKYTWGTQGAPWTGSEEWPGNSRILEVLDVNGDAFVHRRDVFSDEATNKDKSNLNLTGNGTITWTTDLRGCGPESHEQKSTLHNAQKCDDWITPQSIGPINVACPGP